MGNTCACASAANGAIEPNSNSLTAADEQHPLHSCPDPLVYDLVRRHNPHAATQNGQHHLLYNKKNSHYHNITTPKQAATPIAVTATGEVEHELELQGDDDDPGATTTTRLVLRKLKPEAHTHIYAIRSPETDRPEQRPATKKEEEQEEPDLTIDPYIPQQMSPQPRKPGTCFSIYLGISFLLGERQSVPLRTTTRT